MRGGVWYYDFGIRESLGWFDDPVYLQSIADEKALFDKQLNVPHKSEADVLYVWRPGELLLPQAPKYAHLVERDRPLDRRGAA